MKEIEERSVKAILVCFEDINVRITEDGMGLFYRRGLVLELRLTWLVGGVCV